MADLPLAWKANCSKFPNLLDTQCTNARDAWRRVVEHESCWPYESPDGAIFDSECHDDGTLQDGIGISVVFGFVSGAGCKMALYIDDVITHEDCSGLSLEDGLPLRQMLQLTNRIKVVPEIPCAITYKSLLLTKASADVLYSLSWVQVEKGTVLKRLQTPGEPIGSYFTFKDADLDKCGVGRYFTNKFGMEEEKQILWFRTIITFDCHKTRALDTRDTWSSSIPYTCSGGEEIVQLYISRNVKHGSYIEAITKEEADMC